MSTNKRHSSIQLSPIKVRSYLASRGIYSLREFEIAYAQAQGRKETGTENTTPRNAWKGLPVANNRAQDIASFLGLINPLVLLTDTESPWESLVYNSNLHGNWMRFHTREAESFNLIIFDHDTLANEYLDQHSITTQFYLELQAERGDHFLFLMRSTSDFIVLAPVEHANHLNYCTNKGLVYPQNGRVFSFDPNKGGGFRELIGIKVAGNLPFHSRSVHTGYMTNLDELNRFALQVQMDKGLQDKVSVMVYPFLLVTTSERNNFGQPQAS